MPKKGSGMLVLGRVHTHNGQPHYEVWFNVSERIYSVINCRTSKPKQKYLRRVLAEVLHCEPLGVAEFDTVEDLLPASQNWREVHISSYNKEVHIQPELWFSKGVKRRV